MSSSTTVLIRADRRLLDLAPILSMAGAATDSNAVRPSLKQPLGLRGRPYRLGRVQGLLYALPPLAGADPVPDREADHYFHANHFLPGAGGSHLT